MELTSEEINEICRSFRYTHRKVYFGRNKNNKPMYLKFPIFECSWYWGSLFLENRSEFNNITVKYENKNWYNFLKDNYSDFGLDNKELWTFCELLSTINNLNQTAQIFNRGGSNYTENPCSELLKNKDLYLHINKILLPSLFKELENLFINSKSFKKRNKSLFR